VPVLLEIAGVLLEKFLFPFKQTVIICFLPVETVFITRV